MYSVRDPQDVDFDEDQAEEWHNHYLETWEPDHEGDTPLSFERWCDTYYDATVADHY